METDHVPLYVDYSYRYFEAPCIESYPDPSCENLIELTVIYDNAADFVELVNNLPSHLVDEEDFEYDDVWSTLFFYDSLNCTAAVLDGKTKVNKLPLPHHPQDDNAPLHRAARLGSANITALLLQRGFSADARLNYTNFKNMLPLHIILAVLRSHFRDVFRDVPTMGAPMLVQLCGRSIRMLLETVRLLALNTTEIKREFFNYLKRGKALEVGALLLVAKSHILSIAPSTAAKVEGEFRSISEMHQFVLSTIVRLKTVVTKSKELVELETTLELLKVFDKTGDKLAALVRLDFTLTCLAKCSETLLAASLIEDAGFDAKYHTHSHTMSEAESHCLKEAIDAPGKTIRTSDMLPVWVKEAVLTGLGVKSGSITRAMYPSLAQTLPYVNSVSVWTPGSVSPMPENLTLLHHLLKNITPFLGVIKRVFRRG